MPRGQSIELARQFRKEPTAAEVRLWQQLRAGRLHGLKFRRQHPLDSCIADFCCPDKHLVVEVDGGVHLEPENAARDAIRDEWLRSLGYTVLRFTNQQVDTELASVLEQIAAVAEASAR